MYSGITVVKEDADSVLLLGKQARGVVTNL